MNATAVMPTWLVIDSYRNASDSYKARHEREICIFSTRQDETEIASVAILPTDASEEDVAAVLRRADLLAAAPDLRDAVEALIGLVSMVSIRADVPPDLPSALRSNHRYQDALALLKRLGEVK
jgi:hypothetical protein